MALLEPDRAPWPNRIVAAAPIAASDDPLLAAKPMERLQVEVRGDDRMTMASCSDGVGAMRWSNRWPAPPVRSVANRTHAVRDGVLVIGEGAERIVLVDPRDGRRLTAIDDPDDDLDAAAVTVLEAERDGRALITVLGPPGRAHRLTFLDDQGHRTVIDLGFAARWAVQAPGRRAVVVGVGHAVLVDLQGAIPCEVPPAVASATSASSDAHGIWVGNRCYRWAADPP
jgi:hypothetical protein